jgi:uncharacterized protein
LFQIGPRCGCWSAAAPPSCPSTQARPLVFSGTLIGAAFVSTASVALEAGVLLGLAYTATRSLWFPIGIHFGWNFTEGGIFGAPISGLPSQGLLRFPLSGPDILTGGSFGPEASVVSVIVCLIASALIGRMAVRSGRWRTLRSARDRVRLAP